VVYSICTFTAVKAGTAVAVGAQREFRDAIGEAGRRAQARNPDPHARQMLEYFTSPHGMVAFLILSAVLVCVAFVLLSGAGGAISVAVLRKKGPRG
jgi:hypothetical protein